MADPYEDLLAISESFRSVFPLGILPWEGRGTKRRWRANRRRVRRCEKRGHEWSPWFPTLGYSRCRSCGVRSIIRNPTQPIFPPVSPPVDVWIQNLTTIEPSFASAPVGPWTSGSSGAFIFDFTMVD